MLIPDGPIPYNPVASAASDFQQEAPNEAGAYAQLLGNSITGKAITFTAENFQTGIDYLLNKPKISADQVNAMAPIGNDGNPTKITDSPMYPDVADMLIKDKKNELESENALSRYSNANGSVKSFGVGAAAFMSDPLAAVATSYGGAVLGASKVLAGMGALGIDTSSVAARLGARAVSGAVGSPVSMTPLIAAQLGISTYQNGDYNLKSALNDFAFAAAAGAIGHAGFGALSEAGLLKSDGLIKTKAAELIRQPAPVKEAAINSTIADVVNSRPVDTEAVIGKDGAPPDVQSLAEERLRQNRDGYSPNLTPEEVKQAHESMFPEGVKDKPIETIPVEKEVERVAPAIAEKLGDDVKPEVANEIAKIKSDAVLPTNEKIAPFVETTPKPVQSTKIATSEIEPTLPRELRGAKPKYGQDVTPNFASDVDKALYIVREKSNGKPNSASHEKYISFLKNIVGMTDEEIKSSSQQVVKGVGKQAKGKNGSVDIGNIFKREAKSAENLTPETANERIKELTSHAEEHTESWRTEALEPEESEQMELENARNARKTTEDQQSGSRRAEQQITNAGTDARRTASPSVERESPSIARSANGNAAEGIGKSWHSAIGMGDALDVKIAEAEKQLNSLKIPLEERPEIQEAYKASDDAEKIYLDKMKELQECMNINGVV